MSSVFLFLWRSWTLDRNDWRFHEKKSRVTRLSQASRRHQTVNAWSGCLETVADERFLVSTVNSCSTWPWRFRELLLSINPPSTCGTRHRFRKSLRLIPFLLFLCHAQEKSFNRDTEWTARWKISEAVTRDERMSSVFLFLWRSWTLDRNDWPLTPSN